MSNETTTTITLILVGQYAGVNIYRDGISIATSISTSTYTDTGLTPNTTYTYELIAVNSVGDEGLETIIIRKRTLPNITSTSISNITTTQLVLSYSGNFSKVSITRNGIAIAGATNITASTFTDSGLTVNTPYTYVVTPRNSSGKTGTIGTITKSTLPNITNISVTGTTTSQIVLAYSGNYTNVSITRNGTSIATNITTSTYTDSSGLSANTTYTYIVTPYNTDNTAGTIVGTITKYTLPNITSISVTNATSTQIVLAYSGNYTNVSITRNGTSIATNITTSTYTDTGLTEDTSYIYIVSPYNSDNIVGTDTGTITKSTLAILTSFSIPSETTTENVLIFTGTYTNVSITRDGSSIATGVTGTTYTDSGLTANNTHLYVVTPINSVGDAGSTLSVTKSLLPNITTLNISSSTTTQIVLAFVGNFTNVDITRDGSSIATGITTLTYTDTGLTTNTSYTYVVIPKNSSFSGSTSSITQSTLSSITSLSTSGITASQIVLDISGNYTNVTITRNGTSIATGITASTYTDASGLTTNTSYTYAITPYNSSNNANYLGITSITQNTLPTLSTLGISSFTTTQIILEFSGIYTNVSITRNGTSIATNITGTTYIDAGLTPGTSYIYVVIPYNSSNTEGSTLSTTKVTLPNLTSLSISSASETQIVLAYDGSFANVSISRSGTSIATNVTGSSYTDSSGLTTNTSYTYIVTPYNSSDISGSTLSITKVTLPTLSTFINDYGSSSSIRLYSRWTGVFSYINITRNGTEISSFNRNNLLDQKPLSVNTSYTYIATPFNSEDISGTPITLTASTLAIVSNVSATATTITITLQPVGSYSSYNITRDGSSIATGITTSTYTDTGLITNTSYTYVVSSYNILGILSDTDTVTQKTNGTITSLSSTVSSSLVTLNITGNYSFFNVTRNGTTLATNKTAATSWTDSTTYVNNTSYTYIVYPLTVVNGDSDTSASILVYTWPKLSSLTVSSFTASQIVLSYAGTYTNVSITRNGTSIATNVTGTTFTDTGLTGNTSYTYVVTPYNSDNITTGTTLTVTKITLPKLLTFGFYSKTTTSIGVQWTGNYSTITIGRPVSPNETAGYSGVPSYWTFGGLPSNSPLTITARPYNSNNIVGDASYITIYTLPVFTSTMSVSSFTTSQMVLSFPGTFTNVSITRNGTSIATNVTGTTYTDTGLTANTSYTYIVTPYNPSGDAGSITTITNYTLPDVTSFAVSSVSTTEIVLSFSGNYTTVNISKDGTVFYNITGTTFTYTGFSANSLCTFIITPKNASGVVGNTLTTSQVTYPSVSQFFVQTSSTTSSQFLLVFTGNFTNASISRNGTTIATGVQSSSVTRYDSNLTGDTSYEYIMTPYDSTGVAGPTFTMTGRTKPNVTSLSVSSVSATQVVLSFPGNFTNVTITRFLTGPGSPSVSTIESGVTTTTYTDTNLIPNISYTYSVTPYSAVGIVGTSISKTQLTLPSLSTFTNDYSQSSTTTLYLRWSATSNNYFNYVSITRNETSIASNISSGTRELAQSSLSVNTSYTYIITPYNSSNVAGTPITLIASTKALLTSLTASTSTTSSITLLPVGSYTSYNITRGGTSIATGITTSTYTDTGLSTFTAYTYVVTPYNSLGISSTGVSLSNRKTNGTISSVTSTVTASKVSLNITGLFSFVNITRDGTAVATNTSGSNVATFSDFTTTTYVNNAVYTYVVYPLSYSSGVVDTSYTTLVYTWPKLTTLTSSTSSESQIVLAYDGSYTNVSISRSLSSYSGGLYFTIYNGYFADSMTFTSTAALRTSGLLDSSTGYNSNISSINAGTNSAIPSNGSLSTYTVEWVGYFLANVTGTWTFFTNSDDGSYLWIGSNATSGYTTSNAIVNNGSTHGTQERSGTISLVSGTYYPIRILYGDNTGSPDVCIVSFTPPSGTKTSNGSGYYFSVTTSGADTLATNVLGSSYTDSSGLTANTSYTYIVTPYNADNITSGIVKITTRVTLPNITSITMSSATSSQIVLAISGNYETYSIQRNGTSIGTGITASIYTDTGLTTGTSYTYVVTPYNASGIAGTTSTVTKNTTSSITSLLISNVTIASITLAYSGNFTSVSITRDGTSIATGVSASTYTDSGLTVNTSYIYIVIPYNVDGIVGSSSTITKTTLPNMTSISINSVSVTQIVLAYTGNFTNVNISRNGTTIATSVSTSTYTDSGLTANTVYVYVVTPKNSSDSGTATSITQTTLPDITAVGVSSRTSTQIVLSFPGNFTNVSITRGETSIATNVTGNTYTDTGLTSNTGYVYVVTPNNSVGSGTAVSSTLYSLPILSAVTAGTITTSSIQMNISGTYSYVIITRTDGGLTTGNITASTYTDSSGISGGTLYTYTIVPYTVTNVAGTSISLSETTALSSPTDNLLISYTFETASISGTSITNYGTSTSDTIVSGTDMSANYITQSKVGTACLYKNSSGTSSTSAIISLFGSVFASTQPISICFWYKSLVTSPNYSPIFQAQYGTSNQNTTSFRLNGFGTSFVFQSGTTNYGGPTALPSGITNVNDITRWYHVIMTLTGTNIIWYINNSIAGTAVSYSGIPASTYIKATIGTDWNNIDINGSAKYLIDDFKFYTRLLSATERTSISGVPTITSVTNSYETPTKIVLLLVGEYTYVNITRAGTSIATNVTTSTYSDTGLTANTSYTYVVTPFYYSSSDASGYISGVPFTTILSTAFALISAIPISSNTFSSNTKIVTGLNTIQNGTYDASQSSVGESRDVYRAFNGSTSDYWHSGYTGNSGSVTYTQFPYLAGIYQGGGGTSTFYTTTVNTIGTVSGEWMQIYLPYYLQLTSYKILPRNQTGRSPKTFYVVGSNDGSTWNSLDTQTNLSAFTTLTTYTPTIVSAAYYKYFRIIFNALESTGTVVHISQWDLSGNAKTTSSTLPFLTSLSVSSVSSSQVVLAYTGASFSNVSITRNGTSIATSATGTTYTDSSGLTANTSYIYILTPNNATNTGFSSTITQVTLPTLTSLSVSSFTSAQVILTFAGSFTNVSITRNGTSITTSATGTTYTDTGLSTNTSYTYIVTPKNSVGVVGTTILTTTQVTLPTLTTLTASSTDTQIVLTYSGSFTNVSITRDGSSIATGVSGTTYTDTDVITNTTYTYIVTPYNSSGATGTTLSISKSASLVTYTDFQQLLIDKSPWGQYSASSWSGTTLTDLTGNGRHATTANISSGTASGNGASVSIPYIGGSTTGTILWPTGSVPTTFTICSITRYSGSTRARIFSAAGGNFIHGHHNAKRGLAYYNNGWKTNQVNIGTITDWLNMCGSNGISTPNNILVNGVTSGIASGGTGGYRLGINGATMSNIEPSDFQFSHLIIWNQALTAAEMVIVSNAFTSYLSTGSSLILPIPNTPTIGTATAIDSSSVSISFATSYGTASYTVTSSPGSLTSTGTSSPIIVRGLTANTSYTFTATSTNSGGTSSASSATNSVVTFPQTSLSIFSSTTTEIVLAFSGNYTNVSITRNGISIATDVSASTYTDTGLTIDTPYTYIVTPYNSVSVAGSTSSITITLPITIQTFTSSGTFTIPSAKTVNYLIVAGGGGGGNNGDRTGGGGGAGGYIISNSISLSAGSYSVVIGAGGTAGIAGTTLATNGGNSSFNSSTAIGGGRGGGNLGTANTGGSGGGQYHGNATTRAAGTSGQGNSGGVGLNAFGSGTCSAAGGAGATSTGGDATMTRGGNGGTGINISSSNLTGYNSTIVVCGGGGGSAQFLSSATQAASTGGGVGGTGGGGNGAYTFGTATQASATAGTANTGGGGGAGCAAGTGPNNGLSFAGGSGVVIITYY